MFAKIGTTVIDGELKAAVLAACIDAMSRRRLAFALFADNYAPDHQQRRRLPRSSLTCGDYQRGLRLAVTSAALATPRVRKSAPPAKRLGV